MARKSKNYGSNSKCAPDKGTSQRKGASARSGRDSRTREYSQSKGRADSAENANQPRLSSLNDVSWYTRNPGLVLPTASIPYPNRPGMVVPTGTYMKGTTNSVSASVKIPGVFCIDWVPSIGHSDSVTSPASIAAKEIYARVRSAFSGSLDADAPDFLVYMMCLDSVFAYIAALKRVYRILDAYDANNFVMPIEVLDALGFSQPTQKNLRTDKANFMLAINELVLASRKFAMPNVMDIFNRHYWLNDNVYTDAATINSQFYVFRQDGFYKYALLDVNGDPASDGASGAQMTPAPWINSATLTVSDLYEFGDALISALADSDDAYTMSGYLMRAYDGAAQFVVDQITGTEVFAPVYVPEVLMQIENSEALCATAPANVLGNMASTINIWQNPADNALWSTPKLTSAVLPQLQWTAFSPAHLINVRSDMPTVGDTLIATRLKTHFTISYGAGGANSAVLYPGSEIVLLYNVWDGQQGFSVPSTTYINLQEVSSGNANQVMRAIKGLGVMTHYDWHPLVQVIVDSTAPEGSTLGTPETFVLGDIQNLTTIAPTDLANINRVCLYSELNAFGEA